MKKSSFLIFVFSLLFVVLINKVVIQSKYLDIVYFHQNSFHLDENEIENILHFKRASSTERWIVITTVSKPTDDIKTMAAFKDWTIVVVADKKTPKNWSFPNCHFLSVEDQMLLGYDIVSLIPFNSYTRKMIGYLYAIENGAKFIYDTDDDNLPIKGKLDSFDYSNVLSSLVYKNQGKSSFFNVYAHFGRPDIWPRGFPLEEINEEVKGSHFHLCSEIPTPTIQQGLVNQDADVDAVYRMIYVKNKAAGLKVEFDDVAPPVVIDKDTYVPFNSQNTLFHYGAFWALMLPTTVAFRVTDIWRGYFAQRLLHLSGQRLAFYGPNARQNRNPHSYYADYIDETFLYTHSLKMINTLLNWTCPTDKKFVDCILCLSKTMVKENLCQQKDYELTVAWVKDLQKIGYIFPELRNQSYLNNTCSNVGFVSNLEKNIRPFQVQLNSLKKLNHVCKLDVHNELSFSGFSDAIFNHTRNVVVVVVFNHQQFGSIPLLQTIYNPWFTNVIFCGSFPERMHFTRFKQIPSPFQSKYSYINVSSADLHEGYFEYLCLTKVAQMGIKSADGFLVIGDDVMLNFWYSYDTSTVHLYSPSCIVDKSNWWSGEFGESAVQKVQSALNNTSTIKPELKEELQKILMIPLICGADIFFVPMDKLMDFATLSQLFFEHAVFLEIAVPKILAVLGWSNIYMNILSNLTMEKDLSGKYLWGMERENPFVYFNKTSMFIHPVKLSQLEQPFFKSGYCNTYVTSLFSSVSSRNS